MLKHELRPYTTDMDKNKQTQTQKSKNSSEQKVIALLAKQLSKDPKSISLNQRIVEDLGADSLDTVEMLMNLEETYGFAIPDDDVANLKTVGELINYLDKHQS